MNLYRVLRPHCAPSCVLVVAGTKRDAIALTNKTFGPASNARATRLLMDRARILVAGIAAPAANTDAALPARVM